jgi:hypothetical protein
LKEVYERSAFDEAAVLIAGDCIDLEGGAYADPKRGNPYCEAEYVIVEGIELEAPGGVRVDREAASSFGFPPNISRRFGTGTSIQRISNP